MLLSVRKPCCLLIRSMLFVISLSYPAAQQATNVQEQVRAYRAAHEKEIVQEFAQLLSLPNRATDMLNIERKAQFIKEMLEKRGVTVRMLRVGGGPAVVLGELRVSGERPTIGIYAHYDGQPVDTTQWLTPPFSPAIRDSNGKAIDWQAASNFDAEARIYARSASDDKAPIEATMAALDALRASRTPLSVNLKLMFEGEEEAGSLHLPQILEQHPDALDAAIWLLCDGPVHQSGGMQVFFGTRGEIDLEITTYGPVKAVHSGHYGNWAPNPIVLLTHLIDSMRDADGNILIPGFGENVRPLTAAEKRALAQIPSVDGKLRKELAIARPEGSGTPLAEQIMKPGLNLRGIQAGHVGRQATNVISTEAQASIDFRLVPNQTPEEVRKKVEAHVARQGFFIVHQNPDSSTLEAHAQVVKLEWGSGYPPYRESMENPAAQAIVQAIESAAGGPVIQVVSLGGSVPMYLFAGPNSAPVIGVPIANYDNNQHAANENLRLKNLWNAIQIYAGIFAGYEHGQRAAAPNGDVH